MFRTRAALAWLPLALALGGASCGLPWGGRAEPVRIVRGPYLQRPTTDGVIVRWRTSAATPSRLWWGREPGLFSHSVEGHDAVVDHELAVAGLGPGERRYYAVGSSQARLAGGDDLHFFSTLPAPGARTALRVWVAGDPGTGSSEARAVRDAYLRFLSENGRPDLWLTLGDNAYPSGTDEQYQRNFFSVYAAVLQDTPVWPVFGNHDAKSSDANSQQGPYFDDFSLPAHGESGGVPSGTEAYYAFDDGNVHFVILNSYADAEAKPAMLAWLVEDLAATKKDWIVAAMHHPPYSRGTHDSDREHYLIEMRRDVVPLLEAGGADLVLSGHSHDYERSYLLHGLYGPSRELRPENLVDAGDGRRDGDGPYRKGSRAAGTVYVVTGNAGHVGPGPLDHPAMVVSDALPGSLALTIDGCALDAAQVTASGEVIDRFAIEKGPPCRGAGPEP